MNCDFNLQSDEFQSERSLQEKLETEASVESGAEFIIFNAKFSGSQHFEEMSKNIMQSRHVYSNAIATCMNYRVRYKSLLGHQELTTGFIKAVTSLPLNHDLGVCIGLNCQFRCDSFDCCMFSLPNMYEYLLRLGVPQIFRRLWNSFCKRNFIWF